MAQKRYYWLKLQNNFFQDIRIKKLKKIAGGDTFTIIYLKMQLLSLANNGTLFYEGLEQSFVEEIAIQIDEDIENVKLAITYLMNVKLLEQVEVDEYILTETIKNIGSESESAERVRQFRARKEQKSLQCNTNVTLIRDREEKEIEIEKDIKEKKTNCPKQYFENSELNDLFLEFLEMRTKLKAVNSERAINTLLNILKDYSDAKKIELIERSMVNSWKSIFPQKSDKQDVILPKWFKQEIKIPEMTEEEKRIYEYIK